MNKPLVSVIILNYNSRPYIKKCLDTLLAQDYPNFEIIIVNNGSDDGSIDLVRERYARVKKIRIIDPGENLWYSRGSNVGIRASRGAYIFALNQDTVLEQGFIRTLVQELEENSRLGSVTGKLLHYKFEIDSKTRILDSTGMEMFRTRRVIDRGQWEVDHGQYDADTEIFGASGAAAMYRRSALEAIKIHLPNGGFEYFDEDFTAYKEDVDLAWRLQLAGYRCKYLPGARIYHGRSIGRSWPTQLIRFILNRRRQSRLVRKLSFKNHYLMMVKNELPGIFWVQFPFIFGRELLLWIYSIFFEPFQIFALVQFFLQLPSAWRKRRLIMASVKASREDIKKLFH